MIGRQYALFPPADEVLDDADHWRAANFQIGLRRRSVAAWCVLLLC